MISCSFLPVFYEHHQCIKTGKTTPAVTDFTTIENIWLGFYGLGKFETYQFLYGQCTSLIHLQEWMLKLKGEEAICAAAAAFDRWQHQQPADTTVTQPSLLTEAQLQSWQQQGYIRVSDLVQEHVCDAVCELICSRLGVHLSNPDTWYNSHPDWHGLMVQLYQHASIEAIKNLPAIQQVFAELYGTFNLVANTEKVSFNPPETAWWKFSHNKLHWDIDFNNPDLYYIQGLVYLNDVPENRGPLTVVPGFHHQFEHWIKTYPNPHEAHQAMQRTYTGIPIAGKKGDIILWLQTLPHAASANNSDKPRFVQYISFSRL